MTAFALHCRVCEDVAEPEPLASCRRCDGPTDVFYDWSAMGHGISRAAIAAGPDSMWRYQALLPVRGSHGEGPGWTPLVRAGRISSALGIDLFLKLETLNPTHSFKDRVAAVTCAVAREHGLRTICCTSSGNLGEAFAAEAAAAGLEAIVLTPAGEPSAGSTVSVAGSYDDCRRLELELAELFPWGFLASSLHPYAVEGLKTVGYEIAEQLDWTLPDAVVAPVGSGSLFAKIAQGFAELELAGLCDDPRPRMIGGQASGCDPVAAAFDENRPISAVRPETAVDGLAVGDPLFGDLALGAARASGGAIVSIPEREIAGDVAFFTRQTGIVPDAAGGVAFGALLEALRRGDIREGDRVALVVSGGAKPPAQPATQEQEPVAPELDAVLARLGVGS